MVSANHDIFKSNSIFSKWDNIISFSSNHHPALCQVCGSRDHCSLLSERWKYILEIFFHCHFWEWQWPVSVGCVSSCCLNSMSCYWMSQCHSVLLLNTYSCFGTIFNRGKLFFSLFKEIWVSFLCWETPATEALLLIMKDIEGKVVQKTE